MKTFKLPLICLLALAAAPGQGVYAEAPQTNALLVLPSEKTAFDKEFRELLDKGGAKLLDSYPPSVFVGYIPAAMDGTLKEKYGALVYREKVEDWSSFARYGERAVFAVNAWNKRFVEDPPEAPLVVSSSVRRAAKKKEALVLNWNAVMKALYYRLQISQTQEFSTLLVDAKTAANSYVIQPAFWKDGVYYWRVAGVLGLNNGEMKDGAFSETYTFAVSRPGASVRKGLDAPNAPGEKTFSKNIYWGPSGPFKYYRLQVSETAAFEPPLADVFTDTCSYKVSGLPVKADAVYFMRVMGSDGAAYGPWSEPAEIRLETPRRAARSRKKGKE
ncbi:MAG: fibronectin type III domain-containing protein [Elusimicrobiales bacterium]|nr:fibronectin type III domain-containing protein [Elusimicrobiales bacterium]